MITSSRPPVFQEVWDDEDVKRIKNALGNNYFLTEQMDFNNGYCMDRRKKRMVSENQLRNLGNNTKRGIPMAYCSGLLIASKHKNKIFSDFVAFKDCSWTISKSVFTFNTSSSTTEICK